MSYKLIPVKKRKLLVSRGINKIFRLIRDKKRFRIRKKFLETVPSIQANEDFNFTVHMLLCKRDLEMAMCTVKAIDHSIGKGLKFIFHDDGSLSKKDLVFINKHAPGTKVVLRSEADLKAAEELGNYPMIVQYRKNQIMALKLIDVRIWGEGDRFCYIDSDILFFEYPTFLMKAIEGVHPQNYFNKDIGNSYMLSPDEIHSFLGIKPFDRCNAGLWVMEKSDISFEKIEYWLNHNGFKSSLFGYTLEQTFISMLANDSNTGVDYLPDTYDVDFYKDVNTSVCKHYVGRIRHGYELEGLRFWIDKFYHEK